MTQAAFNQLATLSSLLLVSVRCVEVCQCARELQRSIGVVSVREPRPLLRRNQLLRSSWDVQLEVYEGTADASSDRAEVCLGHGTVVAVTGQQTLCQPSLIYIDEVARLLVLGQVGQAKSFQFGFGSSLPPF
jgi:hypothetical protein